MSRSWLLLLFVLASGTLFQPAALAQDSPRCAVMPFEGSGDVVLRRSFMRALEENGFVSVISEDEVDAAAREGATVADVAAATRARLVITGVGSGGRRSRSVELTAYDANGHQVATETIRVRPGGAGRRAINQGVSDLLAAALPAIGVAGGGGSGATSGSGESEEEEEEEEEDDEGEGDDEAEAHVERRGGGSTPAPSTGSFGANPPIFVARLGIVARTRDAETVLSSGAPRSWRSSPMYIELHVGIEIRPLAQSSDLARGLFLRGEFANAVGLGTRDPSGNDVATHFFRAGGDIGYLLPVGSAVEVGLGVGFAWDAYTLGTNFEFPSVELPQVRPLLRGRLRLLDEVIVVGLEAGARFAIDRGALNAAFGGGDTAGFDVGGSVSGALDFGLAYHVEVTWAGFWHGFNGMGGTLGSGVNGTDNGVRILLGAGYAFR